MAANDVVLYALWALVAAILITRIVARTSARSKIPELLKQGAIIIDVRSAREFAAGNAPGSRNIPLADLDHGTRNLDHRQWIIVCCASGTRSGTARRWLVKHGFQQVLNGGSWRNLR